ncbi:MAG: translational machinery protein [Proteobacteria bacterium]|nr:translational machinery protein [Pseudomonadota bacterium]
MTEHFHYIVWLDHEIAKIISFNPEHMATVVVRSARGRQHLHHKANSSDNGHLSLDSDFLDRIAHELQSAGAILITGPASAKTELVQRIHQKHVEIAKRLSGVETLDHPTDGELVAFGRKFFRGADRMRAQVDRLQR